MTAQATTNENSKVKFKRFRTPLWRRLTSAISLGSIVVLIGVAVAAILGAVALMVFVLLEQAVG